ncbi:PadR family transcriptional regulator, partial [Bacillus pumilus]|uniref:PadR family transcriptional regulator n=1 Tax=Bacillus pumilus TaxID=1408 RepID=UPI00119C9EF6
EFSLLPLLNKRHSYPYQIIKHISHSIHISQSTLYPILNPLHQNNYLHTYSHQHNTPLTKYYPMTQTGRHHIPHFLPQSHQLIAIYHFISPPHPNQ